MNWLRNHKSEILVGSGALVAGILSFFITLSVYPSLKNKTMYTGEQDNIEENQLFADNIDHQNVDIVFQDISDDIKNDVADINSNVADENLESSTDYKIEKSDIDSIEKDKKKIFAEIEKTNETITEKNDTSENEVIEAIAMDNTSTSNVKFIMPVSGDIITEFANDKLVFSETLSEWIIHNGIDILGEVAAPVKVVASGVVESVKMDPRYGNTIIVKHEDGYKTIYSNLSTLDLVYVGKKLNSEDIISGVGEGFGFESKEAPHLHFEIMKNGDYLNPIEYLK